jgi:hypothetical protein
MKDLKLTAGILLAMIAALAIAVSSIVAFYILSLWGNTKKKIERTVMGHQLNI